MMRHLNPGRAHTAGTGVNQHGLAMRELTPREKRFICRQEDLPYRRGFDKPPVCRAGPRHAVVHDGFLGITAAPSPAKSPAAATKGLSHGANSFGFPGESPSEDIGFTQRRWIQATPLQRIGAVQGCG